MPKEKDLSVLLLLALPFAQLARAAWFTALTIALCGEFRLAFFTLQSIKSGFRTICHN